MALTYPIELMLEGREVLVVGGGSVAARKVAALMEAGARVRVVSPVITAEIERRPEVVRNRTGYSPDQIANACLVFACTDDPQVNERVAADARAAGRWCNVADNPGTSDFFVPATLRRGELTVAVGTGGASPHLAVTLRDGLESHFEPHLDILVEELKRARRIVLDRVQDPAVRLRVFETICASCSLKLIAARGREAWRDWFERVLEHRGQSGETEVEGIDEI